MVCNDEGSTNSPLKPVHSKNAIVAMESKVLGKVMDGRLSQDRKACPFIVVNESGRVMETKERQFIKVELSMTLSLLGKMTEVNAES